MTPIVQISLDVTNIPEALTTARLVLGAPLTIDADAFRTASGNVADSLRLICEKVHGFGDVPITPR